MTSQTPRRRLGRALKRHLVGLAQNPGIQILRDLGYLVFGQITTKLLGFVLFAYLARTLGPRDYGALETVLAIFAFAVLVIDFGLGQVAVRHRAQGGPDMDLAIGAVPALRLLLAVPCILGTMVAVFFVVSDPVVRVLGYLLAGSLVLQAFRQEWLLQSLEMMKAVALGQFLRVAVLTIAVFLLIKSADDLAWFALAEIAAAVAVSAFYISLQLRAGFALRLSLARRITGPLLRQAFPLGLNAAVWGLVQNLPTLIVGSFAGLEQAAYLAAAQRLATSLQSLSYTYHFNMFAALSRRFRQGPEHLQKLSLASMRLVAWASIGPAAICSVMANDILRLIYGSDYGPAAPALAIAIFTVPVQIMSGHHRWALNAAGETRSVLTAGLVGAGLSALITLGLVFHFGALSGAIAALVAALGIWGVSLYACHARGLPLPVFSRIWLPSVAATIAVLPILLLPNLPALTGLLMSVTIYAFLGLIVDKQRIYQDLKHFAYAKEHLN